MAIAFMYLAGRVPSMLGHHGTFDAWLHTLYFGMSLPGSMMRSARSLGLMGAGAAGGPPGMAAAAAATAATSAVNTAAGAVNSAAQNSTAPAQSGPHPQEPGTVIQAASNTTTTGAGWTRADRNPRRWSHVPVAIPDEPATGKSARNEKAKKTNSQGETTLWTT